MRGRIGVCITSLYGYGQLMAFGVSILIYHGFGLAFLMFVRYTDLFVRIWQLQSAYKRILWFIGPATSICNNWVDLYALQ
jgi:hypothetical protein